MKDLNGREVQHGAGLWSQTVFLFFVFFWGLGLHLLIYWLHLNVLVVILPRNEVINNGMFPSREASAQSSVNIEFGFSDKQQGEIIIPNRFQATKCYHL